VVVLQISGFGFLSAFDLRPSDFNVVSFPKICFTPPMSSRLLWALLGCFLARPAPAISLLTYNVHGNCTCASNWNISLPQVAAQGREVMYLQPDIITFVEIPQPYTYQTTNFVNAFLPGYYAATNSRGDGFITSVTLSRYPILRSTSYLHGTSLTAFGASGYNFTRDLFQSTISVPGFPQPLDVFSTHLKATSSAVSSNSTTYTDGLRRAAEAAAISNWFATYYLPTNGGGPYTLSGDLNEDIARPGDNYVSGHPIQTLISPTTGLRLTTPINSISGSELTLSIQDTLDVRFDYILPCALLHSNIVSSQVFRTDLLSPIPPGLNANDDTVASDHLPVFVVFANPYDTPFHLLSIRVTNTLVTITWESTTGRHYRVDASTGLTTWTPIATNLTATGATLSFTTNSGTTTRFFRVYRAP
jgi:endonuclease/exonuclease/phosphatase family metal-dependent hydrolase